MHFSPQNLLNAEVQMFPKNELWTSVDISTHKLSVKTLKIKINWQRGGHKDKSSLERFDLSDTSSSHLH